MVCFHFEKMTRCRIVQRAFGEREKVLSFDLSKSIKKKRYPSFGDWKLYFTLIKFNNKYVRKRKNSEGQFRIPFKIDHEIVRREL